MWGGMNQRVFPRADYPCRVRVATKLFPQKIDTRTENIGLGGICVVLDKELQKFSKVDLELFLDNGKGVIQCSGKVVWVVKHTQPKNRLTKFDTGIEFIEIADEQKNRIGTIVEKLGKESEEENNA